VGVSEGRAILDIARAARHITEAKAGDTLVIGGHSEGGHGALWGGVLASDYAPELHLAAVLASAPGGDVLASVRVYVQLPDPPADPNLQLLIRSWQQYYDLPVGTIMAPDQAALLPEADTGCRGDLSGVKVQPAFATEPDWVARFRENSPAGHHIPAPILYLQGTADEQVPIAAARAGRDALCRDGDVIEYREFQGEDHNSPLFNHYDDAVRWVLDTLGGREPKNYCR
jgi:hypothetical protein